MAVLPYLIILIMLGFAVAWLARRLEFGHEPRGVDRTFIVAICTAFVAGLFCWYVLNRHGWGMIISVGLSMLAVWLYRRLQSAESRGAAVAGRRRPRPAGYRGSQSAGYRGRPPSARRPPY